jgi:hypothetical protein
MARQVLEKSDRTEIKNWLRTLLIASSRRSTGCNSGEKTGTDNSFKSESTDVVLLGEAIQLLIFPRCWVF